MLKLKEIDSKSLNDEISNAIHSYIADGYRIDAKESVIDPASDGDCTFKAVLTKDVDGIECKAVITLNESKDDNNHACSYSKVDWVGDTKWSEESRSFSTSTGSSKYKCKCPSAFKRLDDYIKLPKSFDLTNTPRYDNVKLEVADKDNTDNTKREDIKDDTFKKLRERLNNIYGTPKDKMSGSFNMNKDSIKEAYDAKARKDWLASKDDPDEEDDLVKLVKLIFGH